MGSETKTKNSFDDLIDPEIQSFWKLVCFFAKKNKLSLKDWEFIADTGTFNRLFRRWYQTN